ncbi:MAG: hypothetical protein KA436_01660 [Oligoflexales bacterium]|nr:hypothetical protein [Oligoflexales bacterium]
MFFLRAVLLSFLFLWSSYSQGEDQVTTFIVKTQEERQSTRFTLTEWLKIKERMKMMDVWLAMFSQPEKDKFHPELDIYYGKELGLFEMTGIEQDPQTDKVPLDKLRRSGEFVGGNLWLTNLFSGVVGIRTLNLDFGLGADLKLSTLDLPSFVLADRPELIAPKFASSLRSYTLNLRIFGKNIQDSSLIVKYGEYSSTREIFTLTSVNANPDFSGKVGGGELQLYLFNWFGLQGNYMNYGESKKADFLSKGFALDYGVFIEVSLLRVMAGYWQEQWVYTPTLAAAEVKENSKGVFGGVRLSL